MMHDLFDILDSFYCHKGHFPQLGGNPIELREISGFLSSNSFMESAQVNCGEKRDMRYLRIVKITKILLLEIFIGICQSGYLRSFGNFGLQPNTLFHNLPWWAHIFRTAFRATSHDSNVISGISYSVATTLFKLLPMPLNKVSNEPNVIISATIHSGKC